MTNERNRGLVRDMYRAEMQKENSKGADLIRRVAELLDAGLVFDGVEMSRADGRDAAEAKHARDYESYLRQLNIEED